MAIQGLRLAGYCDAHLANATSTIGDFLGRSDIRSVRLFNQTDLDVPMDDAPSTEIEHKYPRIPRRLVALAGAVACHRDERKWALLYSLLWRLRFSQSRLRLLDIDVDDEARLLLRPTWRAQSRCNSPALRTSFHRTSPGCVQPGGYLGLIVFLLSNDSRSVIPFKSSRTPSQRS
jgi:hypothetical protein